ncbi:glycine zipper family protein [Flavobacterium faecale]|uniref:Glycine zipper family protein n=1 Tax=Flavobacterium faecale TaxID=1355330 RepID=A0A2S1LBH9_9FLAO|nr:glycine zipper 2TM domain-containing protein [Flavobacterium faecale]AWG21100.1 glycine zipper family protein [Flavobacterium faecale]
MKYIYVALVSLLIVSCKQTDKAGAMADTQINIDSIKQVSVDSMKMEAVKQKTIDSMKIEMANQQKVMAKPEKEVVIVNQAAPAAAPVAKKKWSGTAKGAVIGAGVGAITGAAVSKKKGTGAIIGGLAGAGLGAGTGAIIDGKK